MDLTFVLTHFIWKVSPPLVISGKEGGEKKQNAPKFMYICLKIDL
jgi:hypothetical protein